MRRVPPLAAAIALMAAALLATVWSTRSTVTDASRAVGDGDAIALQQALRADIADLPAAPTDADLGDLLRQHAADGLRYIATLDARGDITASAGRAIGQLGGRVERGVHVEHIGDRIRVELRAPPRRAWAGRPIGTIIELEPVHADALHDAASRTLAIGGIAALTLLIVAGALVRRELRRAADEKLRERERRLASLGEMSAVLAHEIRNPLASLKGNAQLLAQMLPQGDKPRSKAERVVEEARRLEQLTTDLLAFVKTGDVEKQPTDPVQLVRDAAGDAEVDATGAPTSWSLDPARMRQVIGNLVDNARDAGPPVHVGVREERGRLVIEVSDHGPGVPAEDREKIFEPFHTGKTRGTGLGLPIALHVVVAHGGTITVSDAPGGGARFRVEVP